MNFENWIDLATVLSAFSTVAIAFLTWFLWRENRLLRQSGSEPRIVAYFEPHPDGTGGLNIAIANIGTGPAREVSFSIEGDAEDFKKYHLVADPLRARRPFTLITQGDKMSFLFGIGFNLFWPNGEETRGTPDPLKPFEVEVKWKAIGSNAEFSDKFELDIRQFENLPGFVNKPYLLKIEEAIKGVDKQIGALGPQVGKLTNLIEPHGLDSPIVRKEKGNSEDL